jgi:deoxyribodipyrimidine photo-lyase
MDYKFPTDYQSILERVHSVSPQQYGKTRNYLNGAVTCLSPYISRGAITLPEIWELLKKDGCSLKNAYKLVQELAWREFFQRCWWQFGDQIWTDIRQAQSPVSHNEIPAALINASTGIHAIDQGIETLYTTGYLHNHLRMYIAGITCNLGHAHWKAPSKWMYYHLFDGDLASNTLNWQWVAGTFSSKKYIANQENINEYLHDNQQGTFLDKSYSEILNQNIPETLRATQPFHLNTVLPDTAPPVIRTDLPVLLYTSYWLNPNWRAGEAANRILLLDPGHFNQFPVSRKVLDFMLELAVDLIPDIQICTGSPEDFPELMECPAIYTIDHPITGGYPGVKDPYPWLIPGFSGKLSSFFNFWKKAESLLK